MVINQKLTAQKMEKVGGYVTTLFTIEHEVEELICYCCLCSV
jgi:hypothetical protein